MNIEEIAEAYVDAFNRVDVNALAGLMDDNFQFSGPTPDPASRDQFLGLMGLMGHAFPDLQFNTRLVGIDGDVIHFTNQLAGTHTGDLDLSFMGMGVMPPTGRSFSMAREDGEAIVENGRIISVYVQPTEGAGMVAILHQLGIEVPGM